MAKKTVEFVRCDDFEDGVCMEGVALVNKTIVSSAANGVCPRGLQPGCSCEKIKYDKNGMLILPLLSRIMLLQSRAFGDVGFDNGQGATVLKR